MKEKMKIHENAKLAFKGKMFEIYQWEQKLYDGSNQTFEMAKRSPTVQVIAVTGNKIALSKQEQPHKKHEFIALFGGKAEAGEKPLEAAKRELEEESGLASNDWELLKTFQSHSKIEWEVCLYIARDCKKVTEPHLDPGEKIQTIEMTFEEFIDFITSEKYHWASFAREVFLMQKYGKLGGFKEKLFKGKI
jgi:ADP-ribose pyrophosphatase